MVGELKFKDSVRAVKMSRELIAAVLVDRTYVYRLTDLDLKDAIETSENPEGLCILTERVLVCPELDQGTVRISNYETNVVNTINAHDGVIQCLALNNDDTLLATASNKGTLIRIFDVSTGKKLQEVRRGADSAKIYCIAFDPTSKMLAVTSDKGTCHCYHLNQESKKENTKSMLSMFSSVLPSYISSEWSFAQYRFSEEGTPPETKCAFTEKGDGVVLISKTGDYWKLKFNSEMNGMEVEEHIRILDG